MEDLFGYIKAKEIRALSWKQPYASAMLIGKQETRVWNSSYQGLVLICTSRQPYSEESARAISGDEGFYRMCSEIRSYQDGRYMNTLDLNGYAIAVGEIVRSRRMTPRDEVSTYVKYKPHLFVHEYVNVRPIEPIPWTGLQRWKNVDKKVVDNLLYL